MLASLLVMAALAVALILWQGPGLWRDGNLVRLRRSLEKLNDGPAAGRFDEPQWHCLLSAYRDTALGADAGGR